MKFPWLMVKGSECVNFLFNCGFIKSMGLFCHGNVIKYLIKIMTEQVLE